MQLLLIRHAQSANNKLFAETGQAQGRQPDPAISELGVAQARALAGALTSAPYPRITHLYSSLMQRTIQTAAPLAEVLDLPIVARMDTFEHPGPYEGLYSEGKAHPGSPRSVLAAITDRVVLPPEADEDGWFHRGVETEDETMERAQALLKDLRATHADTDVVAIVSHGWFLSVLVRAAVGAAPDAWFSHQNTGTTLIAWEHWAGDGETTGRDQVGVQWLNRLDHLTPEMISE